jgi:serine protease Do
MLNIRNSWKLAAKLLFLSLTLVLAGIFISDQSSKGTSHASNLTTATPPMNDTWRKLNDDFIRVANQTKPTVVTVSTERVLSVNVMPFAGDPFLDFFFDHGDHQMAPEQKQYHQRGLGSGIIVSEDGTILTNNHVIKGADSIYVRTYDGRRFTAKVVGADPKTDIAVIKIKAHDLTPIPIGNSDSLSVGEMVLAIGSPMSENLAYTVTQGIVSAKGRSNMGLADYEDFIQTDAAINPGNSGGPLINLEGRLIGINAAIISQSGGFQGIGFSVPVNMAMQVMHSLISEGRVVRGWLGVSIQDVNDAIAAAMGLKKPGGALVADVIKGSPADDAGLKVGDIILAVNNQPIRTSADLRNIVASSAPGSSISVELQRSGHERTVDVTLSEQPNQTVAAKSESKISELLGFRVSAVRDDLTQQYGTEQGATGVFVVSIDTSSPAYQAGVREGDLIHGINRQPVTSMADFEQATANLKKGDYVLLQVQRSQGMFFIAFQL